MIINKIIKYDEIKVRFLTSQMILIQLDMRNDMSKVPRIDTILLKVLVITAELNIIRIAT